METEDPFGERRTLFLFEKGNTFGVLTIDIREHLLESSLEEGMTD